VVVLGQSLLRVPMNRTLPLPLLGLWWPAAPSKVLDAMNQMEEEVETALALQLEWMEDSQRWKLVVLALELAERPLL
jgi:hypothetical protein